MPGERSENNRAGMTLCELVDFLEEKKRAFRASKSPSELIVDREYQKCLSRFLRGREPVLVPCRDGKIRIVRPAMDVEEVGTNVIPLPVCQRSDL
jgi:hypothetical protein